MDVLRWSPFDDLRSVQDEVNRLFEQRYGNPRQAPARRENVSSRVWAPPVDVLENASEILVRVDLPGVKKEEIQIEMTGESLSISGHRGHPDEGNSEQLVRTERAYGPFQRTFTVGVQLQQDAVTADYEDGVLTIRLPKAEAVKPRRVEVKIGG